MKKSLLTLTALCAAGLTTFAQGQNSSDTTPGSPGSSSKTSGSQNQSSGASATSQYDYQKQGSSRSLSATGRSSGQDVRASKLMGAQIKGSSGSSSVGTINDIIINPMSGRIDFAVISLGSSGSTDSSATSSDNTSPGTTGSRTSSRNTSTGASFGASSSSSEGKLVAVPWNLLRSSGSSSSISGSTAGSVSATTSSSSEVSFVFSGDQTKLKAAPTFDQNSWPDFSQPSFRQSVYSHFGTTSGTSTGGATSPGGTGTSSSGSSLDSSSSTSQGAAGSQGTSGSQGGSQSQSDRPDSSGGSPSKP